MFIKYLHETENKSHLNVNVAAHMLTMAIQYIYVYTEAIPMDLFSNVDNLKDVRCAYLRDVCVLCMWMVVISFVCVFSLET